MRRVTPPVSRRRQQRSVATILDRFTPPRRTATPYRQVTELTRQGSRITYEDLQTIVRILNYTPTSATVIARLPTWQGGQIDRYGTGII